MKTIVFIGTYKYGSSYEALKAADMMQYYTVLLTNQELHIAKRAEFPNVDLMEFCDIDNVSEIAYVINCLIERGLDICAIVSFIDPYCHNAALAAQKFGLKCFSADAISIMLDKIKSREILDGAPCVPFFYKANSDDEFDKKTIKDNLPLVLKVPVSNGSKDVYKIQTHRQYKKAMDEIKIRYPHTPVLLEEFLDGPQYLVETVTIDGNVNIIAIVKQEITFTGRFIVTGYKMIIDNDNKFYDSLEECVNCVIKMHGMEDGPCHLELRYVKNEWKLIEVNPRISGGAMNLFIQTAYGINLVQETLKLALGLEPDFQRRFENEAYLQYVIVPKEGILEKVTGKNRALGCPGVKHVYLKPKKGSVIMPPISMGFRYAYVIATGNTEDEAMENAKLGASQIKFYLLPICDDILEQFSDKDLELLDIAGKNEEYISKLEAFSNNFIFRSQP